jgi:serine/threonine-protein kinase
MISAGEQIGRYKIRSAIGKGGMGEVWLADDIELERLVALKILPKDLANDTERMRRFVQEAKSASALNHPNIITIHEIGKTDNTHFIATEYIEGETLHNRLRSERMNLKSVLDVAIQVASALDAAHRAGIVHRDIKPENVMIRPDGVVKILDFGIAKLTEKKADSIDAEAATAIKADRTSPGMIVGTAAYMSPEQARGKDIDARSDIFSFGVVLYEMLTGKQAFEGESAIDTISAIIHKDPAPLNQITLDIPRQLQHIVEKGLRKDREERYQTAKDLLIDLKDVKQDLDIQNKLERTASPQREEPKTQILNATTIDVAHTTSSAEYVANEIKSHKGGFAIGLIVLLLASIGLGYWFFSNRTSSTAQIESIAVLPFQNTSSNADTEYLSDGLTESLINSLSQLPNMKVIARSSAFRYKGKDVDLAQIAKELNVQAIINGRVVQRGDTLSISVDLTDVQNNTQLWGRQFTKKSSDIFAVQEEITRQITDSLRVRLTGAQEERLTKRYTDNEEAYKLYLQGRFHWNKRNQSLKKAVEYFSQAIEKDPNYALAYAGLAETYALLGEYGVEPARESAPKGKAAALKALDIDSNLAEAYTALAYIKTDYEWDFAGAEKDYLKAIELNPKYATARQWYGEYLTQMARFDEAATQIRQAQEFDPLSPVINQQMTELLILQGQYDKALESSRKTLELEPNFLNAYSDIGWAYEEKKMFDEAFAAYQKRMVVAGESKQKIEALEQAYKKGGWKGYLQKTLEFDKDEFNQGKHSAGSIAGNYALLGEYEEALKWLERSYENREDTMAWLKVGTAYNPMRSDPRFQDLVRRVGLP